MVADAARTSSENVSRGSPATTLNAKGFAPLVSVIPPDGVISPTSRVTPESRGKSPGVLTSHGWIGYNFIDATQAPSPQDIDRWGANVGILADHYPGVDIDVEDEMLAKVVRRFCSEILGKAPVRYSRPPRMLLMYRTQAPFPRTALRLRYDDQDHMVEVLGRGRQFVMAGRHPSGVDYRWDRPLEELTPADLVHITPLDVERLFETLTEALTPRGFECERVGGSAAPGNSPPQDELLAPSIEELRELVAKLPNDYADRDDYIAIGHAIRAAAGPGEEYEALQIFQDWASRWEGGNDPDVAERDFESFKPPFRAGWTTLEREIYKRAQEQLAKKDELRLSAEKVGELERIMPPGLEDDFEYQDGTLLIEVHQDRRSLGLPLVKASELLSRPRIEIPWLVDGLLPARGLSLVVAKPKVGKSTLARSLAVAVAKGEPILGRNTRQHTVIYLAHEDPEQFLREELERLGVCDEELYFFQGPAPHGAIELLRETVRERLPGLVVVDTAQRLLGVRDLNDYAEVTRALDPLLGLSRDPGTHIVLVHHAPKGEREDLADAALGSTALFGSVDTGIFLNRDRSGDRYLETRQRNGDDVESTLVEFDPRTRKIQLGRARHEKRFEEAELSIRAALAESALTEKQLLERTTGKTETTRAALGRMCERGTVARDGKGVRGSPFIYSLANPFHDFPADQLHLALGPSIETQAA